MWNNLVNDSRSQSNVEELLSVISGSVPDGKLFDLPVGHFRLFQILNDILWERGLGWREPERPAMRKDEVPHMSPGRCFPIME